MSRRRGSALLDLLVGSTLALGILAATTGAIGVGGRLLLAGAARGEAEDTAAMAVEALAFDVRRAGWDPSAAGRTPVTEAAADRLTVTADLDANGAVDAASEETVRWVCAAALQRLSRVVGRQSLPLADGVSRCAFRYLDAAGAAIATPPAGLDATGRARVRAVGLDVTLVPTRLRAPVARTAIVALRGTP